MTVVPRSALLAAMAVVLAAAVTVTLLHVLGDDGRTSRGGEVGPVRTLPPPPPSPGDASLGTPRPPTAAATALVDRLGAALRSGDAAAARALAGRPAARRLAGALARNAARLDVVGLHLRPVTETSAPTRLERRYGPGTWVDEVEVTWRYAEVDDRPLTSVTRLVLTSGPAGTTFDSTLPSVDRQTPPWLLEPLTARHRGRVLVAASDPASARRLAEEAVQAVRVVDRRLPAWHGDLVLEAPAAVPVFRAGSGLGAAGARSIAAVTTTADGSTLPGSPERVFVNPHVFAPLGSQAQAIVLGHEATHVAVEAASSNAPLWLTEGFADWVALSDSDAPVRVLASQVRALVRRNGPPRHLPGRADFAASAADLGAAYEAAWLAVRLLARTHGAAALLRFQRLATSRSNVDEAFRVAFGTDQEAFTRAWRRELVRLAH